MKRPNTALTALAICALGLPGVDCATTSRPKVKSVLVQPEDDMFGMAFRGEERCKLETIFLIRGRILRGTERLFRCRVKPECKGLLFGELDLNDAKNKCVDKKTRCREVSQRQLLDEKPPFFD